MLRTLGLVVPSAVFMLASPLHADFLRGDANFDGRVNFVDFQRLELGFGKAIGATWQEGDFNFDGRVDHLDFNILRAGVGNGALAAGQAAELESFAAAHSVPEPSSWMLLAFAGLFVRRRGLQASSVGTDAPLATRRPWH